MWGQRGQTSAQSKTGRTNSWVGYCPLKTASDSSPTWQWPSGQKSLFLVPVQCGQSSMITIKAPDRHEYNRATCSKFLSLSPCQKPITQQTYQNIETWQTLQKYFLKKCSPLLLQQHDRQRGTEMWVYISQEEGHYVAGWTVCALPSSCLTST